VQREEKAYKVRPPCLFLMQKKEGFAVSFTAITLCVLPSCAFFVSIGDRNEVWSVSLRLALNVKGEGYAIHETLNIESADGNVVTLAPRQLNVIDFGQVS
jgi:hypothetical protein